MAEIRLEEAIFGMSNNNHVHVHRHNQLLLDPQQVDQLKMESMGGGVRSSTLNDIALKAGSLSTVAQGAVDLEEGWNLRRGLGMLRFMVTQNGLVEEELCILGYLKGGSASVMGIEGHTMFVPVRSWSKVTENKQNPLDGMDYSQTTINDSSQFLMGDPGQTKRLQSLRPIDIADSVVGYAAVQAEDSGPKTFDGNIGSDLQVNGITVSKTHNLNPVFHSRELIKMASNVLGDTAAQYGTQYALTDATAAPGLGEMHPTENPFLRTMQHQTGMHTFRGFDGFTMDEIAAVFANLADVLNVNLLDETSYPGVDNTATSNEYGTSSPYEILGSELAYITVHSLIQCGLMSVSFSATNDFSETGGLANNNGTVFIPGESMSLLNHDDALAARVERFMNLVDQNFFTKLNGPYHHNRTIVGVKVESYLFGETVVEISLNGNFNDQRRYVNATFAINRHSTNIGANQVSVDQATNFFESIRNYLQ
ncbi:hypothetical protein RISINGSUN_40 [Erwinia phage vB_EamM_RisingSun]|uniref:Uncharacterized protein n=2 Tax=Risingsunvirus risingsun TaxID=2560435 RepID=A0A223LI24_9CAUD|nr:hypothetical protein FDI45_gp040 [Erwinia phage vB_EamM_RisingSun]ASU03630.1 hypothetical protein RISINGSUN_40 [Erwinia phage vB_EamM_RisingSun]ASU03875.1 hypothetical protein JOAD_40 [Erwinia phage vB_EamM_Joad]